MLQFRGLSLRHKEQPQRVATKSSHKEAQEAQDGQKECVVALNVRFRLAYKGTVPFGIKRTVPFGIQTHGSVWYTLAALVWLLLLVPLVALVANFLCLLVAKFCAF